MSSCFSRRLRVPIAMRQFYEQTLWIPQKFLVDESGLAPRAAKHAYSGAVPGSDKLWIDQGRPNKYPGCCASFKCGQQEAFDLSYPDQRQFCSAKQLQSETEHRGDLYDP